MGWSFPIARISGIDIKVHATFFLILVLGAVQWGSGGGLRGAAFGVILMLLLFVCVTLHELGHSVVAQAYKIPVREIVLLPIGGVALISKMPEKPVQELLIAAAGPFVNVVIAGALVVGTGGATIAPLDAHGMAPGGAPDLSLAALVTWLFYANVSLVLFNLIPAFPLDGGRMLRALLAFALPFHKATRVAAVIGQGLAVVLGLFGLVAGHLLLALIAVFIFFGAGYEGAHAQAKVVLKTLRVGDAYNKHALTLRPDDRLSHVVDLILTSYQPDFAVIHGGRLVGVVTRKDVLRVLAGESGDPYVAGMMEREFLTVDPATPLDEVRQAMAEGGHRLAAVFDGDRYLGLVSQEDIAEAMSVLRFVRERESRAGRSG